MQHARDAKHIRQRYLLLNYSQCGLRDQLDVT